VLVVIVVVVIHVVMVAALPLRFFEFMAALARLFAVLAVAAHGIAQLIFRLVNASFTLFVSVVSVFRAYWAGRSHQTDDRQRCNAENSDDASHVFSL
jgi:NADH:ubiquinone oxidoreductase subunit 5 (subunit L)/multisubunit Na+/H+ antiporter MnhA subunit